MKYYIEKDNFNRVVTKGTTIDDAFIEKPLIEVTEEEFNAIEQYMPPIEPTPQEPTENEMIMLAIADLDMQRELDKTETQLAIAELAEILIGSV